MGRSVKGQAMTEFIFMSFVAFNGLIASAMDSMKGTGAELVIPTDSSRLLPGYYLFIGFCLASLFLSRKLERGIKTAQNAERVDASAPSES